MKVSFSLPDVTKSEINAVAEVLQSGWITTGPKTKELEKKIGAWIGVENNCVCMNSQTACAEMALRLLGIGEGDEVIVPAYTYTASASVICHVGAKPVMIDCQPHSLEMDYDAVENAVTENTKAIIPVDLGGIPCDYSRIYEIAEKKKHLFRPGSDLQAALGRVAVMADAAHAFGAIWHDKMVGAIADFSAFSFHAVKNFTTAEGGCLTWKSIPGVSDSDIYHRLQLLTLHGQSKDALEKTQLGTWEYDIVGTWYKCNMTDVAAAMGLKQFERYPKMLAKRERFIARYNAAFEPLGIKALKHYTTDYRSSGHLYITRVFKSNGEPVSDQERRKIIIKMAEAGISCNVHYKPLPMHTAYRQMGFDIKNYPNAYAQYENEITLPLHTRMTDDEVEYVIQEYCRIVKEQVWN